LKIPLVKTEKLREVNVGQAEGLGYQEAIDLLGSQTIQRWRSIHPRDLEFSFPQGETKLAAVSRTLRVLEDFLHSAKANRIAVITHGMLIRTLLHYLFPQLEEPLVVPNCSYFHLSYDDLSQRWSLISGIEQETEMKPWERPSMKSSGSSTIEDQRISK
jgi:broad specificity phosphatase PhoE